MVDVVLLEDLGVVTALRLGVPSDPLLGTIPNWGCTTALVGAALVGAVSLGTVPIRGCTTIHLVNVIAASPASTTLDFCWPGLASCANSQIALALLARMGAS